MSRDGFLSEHGHNSCPCMTIYVIISGLCKYGSNKYITGQLRNLGALMYRIYSEGTPVNIVYYAQVMGVHFKSLYHVLKTS